MNLTIKPLCGRHSDCPPVSSSGSTVATSRDLLSQRDVSIGQTFHKALSKVPHLMERISASCRFRTNESSRRSTLIRKAIFFTGRT